MGCLHAIPKDIRSFQLPETWTKLMDGGTSGHAGVKLFEASASWKPVTLMGDKPLESFNELLNYLRVGTPLSVTGLRDAEASMEFVFECISESVHESTQATQV